MKIPFQSPDPAGTERAKQARDFRNLASEVSRIRPQALTRTNGEETDYGPDSSDPVKKGGKIHHPSYPTNFTKGLAHNQDGVVDDAADYHCFVEAINSSDRNLFEKGIETAQTRNVSFHCKLKGNKTPDWRGWESPRAGHVYELQGPDAGAVAMAPAPRVGSSELSAEMAEVYGLALLRDVPFTEIDKGGSKKLCDGGGNSILSANEVVDALNTMPFFAGTDGSGRVSSTPHHVGDGGLNLFEQRRRDARTVGDATALLSTQSVFRGSTIGAMEGPYISQFMLAGNDSLRAGAGPGSNFPGTNASYDPEDGFINFGSQIIDQRGTTAKACLDYMTNWAGWLDVQNGAAVGGIDKFDDKRRFITTPRDLATYVHYDALYQAYLNACLVLLGLGTPTSKGFPEASPTGHRTAFATFGGPHILSLVTEVATRCLKAVRRQKFNYHRRARPEVMGGRFSLVSAKKHGKALGCAADAFEASFNEIPESIRDAVVEHNKQQNTAAMNAMRDIKCPNNVTPHGLSAAQFAKHNLLLPMAFPEGSPMHPAYGAGHATVAGGCVTMLKAFFEMFDPKGRDGKRLLDFGSADYFVPNATGKNLVKKNDGKLTIQGELDKLAANISIGRNMAGVHYYSDYYDSMRMGERIAVGILMEQAPTYGDEMSTTFDSFDKDHIEISGEAGSCPTLSVLDADGRALRAEEWWLRHGSGDEIILPF
ncbi:MAG: vanadium-dependent haloperoxidase [Pseudomonadota bacterium]